MPGRLRDWLQRLRERLRPRRRLRLLRPGGLLIGGIFGLGFATLNTGNNLLYLLLGALLGLIMLSGMLSEQALRGLHVRRRVPRSITRGEPAAMRYTVSKAAGRLPSFAVSVRERSGGDVGFVLALAPDSQVSVRTRSIFPQRGVIELRDIIMSTTFPFGLFAKERDVRARDVVLVRPPVTRPVRDVRAGGRDGARVSEFAARAAGGERGEFRGLRAYRSGDDPRDVHWRSSARRSEPVVREYDREQGRCYTLYLDTTQAPGEPAETTVEIVAALAAAGTARGDLIGLLAGEQSVSPGTGAAQLDRILDALARVRFPTASPLPDDPAECVWVGTSAPTAEFGDVFIAGVDG